MKKVIIQIEVKSPDDVAPENVAAVVGQLIEIGLADAAETLEQEEGDLESAELAAGLSIAAPKVIPALPRCVIEVADGSYNGHFCDITLDVHVFDWVDHDFAPEKCRLPSRYADLVVGTEIPLEPEEEVHGDKTE